MGLFKPREEKKLERSGVDYLVAKCSVKSNTRGFTAVVRGDELSLYIFSDDPTQLVEQREALRSVMKTQEFQVLDVTDREEHVTRMYVEGAYGTPGGEIFGSVNLSIEANGGFAALTEKLDTAIGKAEPTSQVDRLAARDAASNERSR